MIVKKDFLFFRYAGRAVAASPATGSKHTHGNEVKKLYDAALKV